MLAREHRITQGTDFSLVMRSGVRIGRRNVVLYGIKKPGEFKAGIIVSKAVGNAVKRNLVKRRLREIVRSELGTSNLWLVVRALPAAAQADFAELREDMTSALRRLDHKLGDEQASQKGKEVR